MIFITGFIVGLFTGSVGIGGVLLVPALVIFTGLSVRDAVATALFSFIFTGMLGSWLFARRQSIAWEMTLPVCIGALGFGYLGTLVNNVFSSTALSTIIAIVLLCVGICGFVPEKNYSGGEAWNAFTRQLGKHA